MATSIGVSSIIAEKPLIITKDDCSYYGRLNTTGFGIIRSYEGIPENIIINLIVSVVCQSKSVKQIEMNHILKI